MNVHVVASEWESDQILSRLARILCDQTGYTVSGTPDPTADVNYFIPYIWHAQKHLDWKATKVACYFSHHDTQAQEKDRWWKQSAERADLRIVTALKYGHEVKQYGPTVYAHAPVDHLKFALATRPIRNVPRVGVSGYSYGDGRKGEALVARLVADTRFNWLDWQAAGRGWRIPHIEDYHWEKLQGFYQELDIFICASLIEGVPMPPLEMLATGGRVVIPRDVGMLDELPDLPGIYRFKAGDYDSLAEALQYAIQERGEVDRAGLREAAAAWNTKAWALDHVEAFEEVFGEQLPEQESLPDWREGGRTGVYYVAIGEPARKGVQQAITSFQEFMPNIPAALAAEAPTGVEDVFIKSEMVDIGGRSQKLRIYNLAPTQWQYILYLDADTEVIADIGFLFDLLQDGWEFVICRNPDKYHVVRKMGRPDNQPEVEETLRILGSEELIQYNGGVFAFRRCERVERFFAAWYEEWHTRWASRDQAALLRALWRVPLRMYILGTEWNTVTRYDDPDDSAGILHYPSTVRQWSGIVPGRLDSPEAKSKIIK